MTASTVEAAAERPIAGVDGCRGGWIAAWRRPGGASGLAVHPTFAALLAALPDETVVVVDMPIGLPERIAGAGRAAEVAARPHLGARRASLFAMPARAAVEIDPGPHPDETTRAAAHRRAGDTARRLSDPPRGVSRQGFMLFPRILEIDRLLRADAALAARVHEGHPELAFAIIGGGAMASPKKLRGRVHEPGMIERRACLEAAGLAPSLLDGPPPRGAGEDDRLDACVLLLVAQRIVAGTALSFPDPPERDRFGLPVAIRA